MRALVSEKMGPPETLEVRSVVLPEPGAGELRIRVEACGINYPDVLMIEDKYQFPVQRPFAPGIEICGIVDAVGQGGCRFVPGMRVLAQIDHGGLAEQAIAQDAATYAVPDGIKPQMAASMLLTYATALHALQDRGRIKKGDRLLVLGSGGGVGLAAVDLGKYFGAHVIAGASSEAKAAAAKAAGADDIFIYPAQTTDGRAFGDLLKNQAPDGFDLIFDPIGGQYCEPALRRVAWDGRYLVVGFAGGIPAPALNLALLKGCSIVGVFWGAFASRYPAQAQQRIESLMTMLGDAAIAPPVPTLYSLEDAPAALSALQNRLAVGKMVVIP